MTTRENNILRLCEMNVMTSVDISHHVSKNPSAPVDYIMESTCLLNSNSSPYVSVHGYTYDVSSNNNNNNNNVSLRIRNFDLNLILNLDININETNV
jgi:hypothetical protein